MLGQIGAILLVSGTGIVGLLAFLLAIYGLLTINHAVGRMVASSASRHWLEAKGVVIASQVVEIKPRRKFPFSDTRIFAPQLLYSYHAESDEHNSQKLNFDPTPSFFLPIAGFEQRFSQQIVERYPIGSEVPIYFDPKDATRAVLERNAPHAGTYAATGLLLALIGASGAFVCWELLKSFLNF